MKQYIFSSTLGLIILGFFQFIFLNSTNQQLRVYFLDVGQGDAALIRYPTGENLLIDTGKDSRIFRELDKVLPWYDKTIDYILLTHGDLDHAGAMLDILDRYSVSKVFVNEFFAEEGIEQEILKKIKEQNISMAVLSQGDILTFGTSASNTFTILHPNSDCMIIFKSKNECSLVALFEYGEKTFLFTGDIGKKVETDIQKFITKPIDVLKVGHHGSKNSTDEEFIKHIQPQYSILSVGNNSYGHPHPDVLSILTQASSTIFSTKEAATIVAASNGTSLEVKQLFDQSRFFQSSICTILFYSFDTAC